MTMTNEIQTTPAPESLRPSRTAMKRDMERLQNIGKSLVELPAGKLAKIELAEPLQKAVTEARRLTAKGALRRQIQFIGRIMEDFDIADISKQLRLIDHAPGRAKASANKIKDSARQAAAALLAGDDEELFRRYGSRLDRTALQTLRTQIRQAKKEMARDPQSASPLKTLALCVSQLAFTDCSAMMTPSTHSELS